MTPPRRLAGHLHGRQEQGDEHADNGNHHQQLDERKRSLSPAHGSSPPDSGRITCADPPATFTPAVDDKTTSTD
jgi:hypothetical protein